MKSALALVASLVLGAGAGYGTWRFLAGREPEPVIVDGPSIVITDTPAATVRRVVLPAGGGRVAQGNELAALNNDGVAALEAGELDRAIELLGRCVEQAPGEGVFGANLAEALARRAVDDHASADGDRERALADLARAVELAPSRTDLVELLARWRAAAEVEADFAAYRSQHFELAFDGERHEILDGAQDAIDLLEDAYGEFRDLLGADPLRTTGRRIRVVLTNREQFERSTGLGHWAGGAYDGTLRLPIDDFRGGRASWSQVLRHELLHLFVHAVGGTSVPGWLNEGLAQWVEETRARDLENARRAVRGRELLSLADLSAPLARLGDPERIGQAYRQSLLFVDFLMTQYGEWAVLQLVERAGRGQPVELSFKDLVGVELEEALSQLGERLR